MSSKPVHRLSLGKGAGLLPGRRGRRKSFSKGEAMRVESGRLTRWMEGKAILGHRRSRCKGSR
jgi:hypothetical protein